MQESFFHYLWKHRLYDFVNLKTTAGEDVSVIHPGFSHVHAGPDFKQALIKIDDVTWAGDVEIHVHSSDWLKHEHQHDPKYQSIILHVVYNHDTEIGRESGGVFPTLELKNYVSQKIIDRYRELSLSENVLPCRNQLEYIDRLNFTSFLSGLAMERLINRQNVIFEILRQCENSWEETFYRLLLIGFGFKTNATAFELLGKSLPFKYLKRHLTVKLQLYALVFGQAGMLEKSEDNDSYFQILQSEYQYLKHKYGIFPIQEKSWNYLRLRPPNFPCIRLAQLCELLYRIPNLFHLLIHDENITNYNALLSHPPDEYWQTHFYFGKTTKKKNVTLGKDATDLLLINTVVPALFAYATFHGEEKLQIRAMSILENIEFESNSVTKIYKEAGFPSEGALYSQAILELNKRYCPQKQCLKCSIGSAILRREE